MYSPATTKGWRFSLALVLLPFTAKTKEVRLGKVTRFTVRATLSDHLLSQKLIFDSTLQGAEALSLLLLLRLLLWLLLLLLLLQEQLFLFLCLTWNFIWFTKSKPSLYHLQHERQIKKQKTIAYTAEWSFVKADMSGHYKNRKTIPFPQFPSPLF